MKNKENNKDASKLPTGTSDSNTNPFSRKYMTNKENNWQERFGDKFAPRGKENKTEGYSWSTQDMGGYYHVVDFISQELTRQNKRLNEECEKIVNRELKALSKRIIKRLEKNGKSRNTI